MQDYADKYTAARDTYIDAAEALKLATGPYKASRDAYVAASKFMLAQRDEAQAHYARLYVSLGCSNTTLDIQRAIDVIRSASLPHTWIRILRNKERSRSES